MCTTVADAETVVAGEMLGSEAAGYYDTARLFYVRKERRVFDFTCSLLFLVDILH